MKFERLSNNELRSLEKEFIQFLVVNGIVAADWEKIKKEDAEKAEKLIELFSDKIWEKSLEKINYLEHRTPNSIKVFYCKKDMIELIGVDADHQGFIDKELVIDPQKKYSLIEYKKKYHPDRETELFKMIKSGCYISSEKNFNLLKSLNDS